MMQQNAKKLALGYLAQAQALLPKVGIDDAADLERGTMARPGKLADTELATVYARLAQAQSALGQVAAAKATLARAQSQVTNGSQIRQGMVGVLLDTLLGLKLSAEAVALHSRYPTTPERAARLASALTEKEAVPVLRQGGAVAAKLSHPDKVLVAYSLLIVAAQKAGAHEERDRILAAMEPRVASFMKEFGNDKYADVAVSTICQSICRSIPLGLKTDQGLLEKYLQARTKLHPGDAGLGYLYLGQAESAMQALAGLTKDSPLFHFPAQLAPELGHDDYANLIKRTRQTSICTRDALDRDVDIVPDFRRKLLLLAESLEPECVGAQGWFEFLGFVPGGTDSQSQKKLRAALVAGLKDREAFWKETEPQNALRELTEFVVQAAKADPTLALKYLPRLTDPARRLVGLAALAEAEAQRATGSQKR